MAWSHISGARCIVETQMEGITVEPSQGTHFFQNITSFGIGYFTLGAEGPSSHLDTDWLMAQAPTTETEHIRHVRLDDPLEIVVNSRSGFGVIMKPGLSVLPDKGDVKS